jgi:RNA polymerase sigma factor (sigma-70 family)
MAATALPVRSRRAARRRRASAVGDDRLVARVRAGDHDAFEAIYDRYYLGLLAFCRHMLGSRHEAEDALQHSFASAYRALRGGSGDIDLRPWLYTIARNRCLSALRAQRDELALDGIEIGGRPHDGLTAEIQLRADLRDLVEDLQRLPDDQRAALVLFELGDQSHQQIAAVLGVRREKVKALVFQAREALLRARNARATPCAEIREQLATLRGDAPRRSLLRSHIDRCSGCAAFAHDVRRQRAAFAAILPVAPTVGLKASALTFLGGGGAAALGGAGTATVAGGVGTATVAGGVAAGGTTVGLASLGAKGVVTKVLAVVALAGGASGAREHAHSTPAALAPVRQQVVTSYVAPRAARPQVANYASPATRHVSRGKAPRAAAPAPAPPPTTPTAAPAPAATHAPLAPTAPPEAQPAVTAEEQMPAPAPAATPPPANEPAPTSTAPTTPAAPAAPTGSTTTTTTSADTPASTPSSPAPASTTPVGGATAPGTATTDPPAASAPAAPATQPAP